MEQYKNFIIYEKEIKYQIHYLQHVTTGIPLFHIYIEMFKMFSKKHLEGINRFIIVIQKSYTHFKKCLLIYLNN